MLTTPADFVTFEGGSGQYRAQAVADALMLAESDVSGWLNAFLTPTSLIDEVTWPIDDNKIMLRRVRLISVESVIAVHVIGCNCQEVDVVGCAAILNARHGIIRVLNCNGAISGCYTCQCPQRLRVTYTSGFTAGQSDPATPDGKKLFAGIFATAVGHLQATVGLDAMGDRAVTSWNSAGYSESSAFNERSGVEEMIHPMIQQGYQLVRKLQVKRAISMRMSKGMEVTT